MSSFKLEVNLHGESPDTWTPNGMRFATAEEAADYGRDIYMRWTSVRDKRVMPSDDPVNYRWQDGRAVRLEVVS